MSDDAKDAARYRFLRDTMFDAANVPDDFTGDMIMAPPRVATIEDGVVIMKNPCHGKDLDAAIDAALDGETVSLYQPLKLFGSAPIKMEGTRQCRICDSSWAYCNCPDGPK